MSSHDDNELSNLFLKHGSSMKDCVRGPAVMHGDHGYPVVKDEEDEVRLKGLCQWTTSDGKRFVPASKTCDKLTPGVYEIMHSQNIGIYFEKVLVITEGMLRFPQTNSDKVVTEIQKFWEREDLFKEYGLIHKRGIILWGPPGCHAPGTLVRMFDGSTKKVEDVRVGDLLMGPDSKSRKVLELCCGRQEMYKITPTKGSAFVVNADHILHLEWSGVREGKPAKNISVREYLGLSAWQKQKYKLRYSVPVHKQGHAGRPNKNNLRTGFKADAVGQGDYYGFILDQDHLYLTADYMIHHNSGKSCTVQIIMQDVVDRGGIVVKFGHPSMFTEGMRILREVEPLTPVVVLMEDIDSTISMYNESDVLNILDGVDKVNKCCFLATTNYPENLGARIMNRPSRFDKRFKIGHPNKESRRLYLKHIIGTDEKIKELNISLDRWVEDTDGFSIAHLKELFVAVVILGDDYTQAIKTLSRMREKVSSEMDEKTGGMGLLPCRSWDDDE